MSLGNIINIATSGVLAQQSAIAATAENIANITTPDFTRREVRFQSDAIPNQFSGVSIEIVRAAANEFLQQASFSGASDVGALDAIAESLARVVGSLGTSTDAISFADRASDAVAALAQLNANPASSAAQAQAIAALDSVFAAFQQTQNAISNEVDRALTGLRFDVDRANQLLEEIATLNNQVAAGGADSNGPVDALGPRLSELAGLLAINVTRDDIGRATIATGDGRILASPGGFAVLSLAGGAAPQLGVSALSNNPDGQGATTITAEISGGSIGGALSLLGTELPGLVALVGAAQAGFANALNQANAANTSFPPPEQLISARLPGDGEIASLSGRSTLALVDANGVLTARLDFDFDAGTLRVNGGAPTSFTPTAAGIASAVDGALGGAGSASINDGVLEIAAGAGQGLAFGDDQAGLAAVFGFNSLIVAAGAGFEVAASVRADPSTLAVARLSLEGASVGDRLTGPDDGRGAAALFAAGRGQAAQLAGTIGTFGARSNAAAGRAGAAAAFSADINARLLEESGVNLEQELSNLILFQRSFNANARILAVADELYQSVLALI